MLEYKKQNQLSYFELAKRITGESSLYPEDSFVDSLKNIKKRHSIPRSYNCEMGALFGKKHIIEVIFNDDYFILRYFDHIFRQITAKASFKNFYLENFLKTFFKLGDTYFNSRDDATFSLHQKCNFIISVALLRLKKEGITSKNEKEFQILVKKALVRTVMPYLASKSGLQAFRDKIFSLSTSDSWVTDVDKMYIDFTFECICDYLEKN